ncbi:THR4 [Candida oxycetoniae]|uniref:threonine synthase n=1 Tax=Candida oxycetoniae TaxID=497107 RepID=A0AAI9SXE5_9ASCO|nr:THR4 [Candida oxycetoniae]KAI3404868.2 THR4 [Candida oxycetoniae]
MYTSTRATTPQSLSFEEVVMTGLAPDGGLYLPSSIPKIPIADWSSLSFQDLAFQIMRLYIPSSEIPDSHLSSLISKSYASFKSDEITPLYNVNENLYLLELFHGPTYAFKDVALQFVGNLFEYFLQRKKSNPITVVGATSGDTGSAAIYGLRAKKDVKVFILYPTGRISPIQELQMSTVPDENVHALSVNGTFDDCQDIVKAIFADKSFASYNVAAVNSINWARILAQITYYFYAFYRVKGTVRFVVPSGNFGDILAGYFAYRMGLPIDKLIIATNENDILDRFLKSGVYAKGSSVKSTHSPAMDILVSSNFERLLWYLAEGSDSERGGTVCSYMDSLKREGSFSVPNSVLSQAREIFDSSSVTNDATIATIKKFYASHKYVIDPHTAVGVNTALRFLENHPATYISLSTAHPAKFSEPVNKALASFPEYSFDKIIPDDLKRLSSLKKRVTYVDASLEAVENAIKHLY